MKRSLLAAAVYAACIVVQWELVGLGLVERVDARGITALCGVGVFGFLVAIRTGFSTRFRDAALTMPQMVFALVCLATAYRVNPTCRGSVTLIIPLVLVFGAFILPARRCVQLGWLAVAIFGATIGEGMVSRPDVFGPLVEIHALGFIVLVVPAIAHLAGQLGQMRIDQKIQRDQLRDALDKLQRLATHDPLTGLPNRRHVDERICDVLGAARKRRLPLSVAVLDLDLFKQVNDRFGHAVGDEVLRIFAREGGRVLREGDVLARWGGEEFLLVLPGCGVAAARVAVERMRAELAASPAWDAASCPKVTFSAGIVEIGADETLQEAMARADAALYEAKLRGRNRTVATDQPAVSPPVAASRAEAPRIIDRLSSVV